MIIIVGLGNPEKRYEKTRHNIGFRVVEDFASRIGAEPFKLDKRKKTLTSEGVLTFPDQKKHVRVILAKPQTYMNNSGTAVASLVKYHKIRTEDQLWIIHDDIDVDLGVTKVRLNGSSAGQKGVQSIIDTLGTSVFVRFRFGIRPTDGTVRSTESFVLEKFRSNEEKIVKEQIKTVVDSLVDSCDKGVLQGTSI